MFTLAVDICELRHLWTTTCKVQIQGAESMRKVRVEYHPPQKFCLPILDSCLTVQHTEIGKCIFKSQHHSWNYVCALKAGKFVDL